MWGQDSVVWPLPKTRILESTLQGKSFSCSTFSKTGMLESTLQEQKFDIPDIFPNRYAGICPLGAKVCMLESTLWGEAKNVICRICSSLQHCKKMFKTLELNHFSKKFKTLGQM